MKLKAGFLLFALTLTLNGCARHAADLQMTAAEFATVTAQAEAEVQPDAATQAFMKSVVENLREPLKLTPEQETKIHALFVQLAVEFRKDMFILGAAIRTGKTVPKVERAGPTPEEQFLALLTPEQLPLYEQLRPAKTSQSHPPKEENLRLARARAKEELNRLKPELKLALIQEEQLLVILEGYELAGLDPDWARSTPVRTVREVLTAEQFKRYHQLQQNKIDYGIAFPSAFLFR